MRDKILLGDNLELKACFTPYQNDCTTVELKESLNLWQGNA